MRASPLRCCRRGPAVPARWHQLTPLADSSTESPQHCVVILKRLRNCLGGAIGFREGVAGSPVSQMCRPSPRLSPAEGVAGSPVSQMCRPSARLSPPEGVARGPLEMGGRQERCPPSLLSPTRRTTKSSSSEAPADGLWLATGLGALRTIHAIRSRTVLPQPIWSELTAGLRPWPQTVRRSPPKLEGCSLRPTHSRLKIIQTGHHKRGAKEDNTASNEVLGTTSNEVLRYNVKRGTPAQRQTKSPAITVTNRSQSG